MPLEYRVFIIFSLLNVRMKATSLYYVNFEEKKIFTSACTIFLEKNKILQLKNPENFEKNPDFILEEGVIPFNSLNILPKDLLPLLTR